MHNKKIVMMPLMAIVALSVLGFAYATWWDYVQIEGTVNMAALEIGFTEQEFPVCTDNEDWDGNGIIELPEKDIGDVDCFYTDRFEAAHRPGLFAYKTLIITITDAYPCYMANTVFVIENVGTIPAHIIDLEIAVTDVTEGIDLEFNPLIGAWVYPAEPDVPILNVDIVNTLCQQIDPYDDLATPELENKLKAEIDIHTKQEARECHQYFVKVKITAVNWNEA